MSGSSPPNPNVKQVVPFFMVTIMDRSLAFYTEGLRFTLKNQWTVDGKIRWCWLELGGAAIMLQEYNPGRIPTQKLGEGTSIWFQCEDAISLYREFRTRGIAASEPQVGNSMWDTMLSDPDGYRLHFESPTQLPEDTKLSEVQL
ncbi:MAG TPA: VOC family protein [Candidatus Acidoferrum sp.]